MIPKRFLIPVVATLSVVLHPTLSTAETAKPNKTTAKAAATEEPDNVHNALLPDAEANYAYRWLNVCEEVAANEVDRVGARPTVISRQMAIWATAMYDAWSCYDAKAVGSRLGGTLRRPEAERTLANKNKAVSYASYFALLDVYPAEKPLLDDTMKKLGYDSEVRSKDATKPEGVGFLCAEALINYRHHDGANQLADEIGGGPAPYSDYTYYKPVNQPDKINNPDRWQEITFDKPDGKGKITPSCLTPHWYRVVPFILEKSSQFRPGPPPNTVDSAAELKKQADEVLEHNAALTPEQKGVVEFMRDGPRSTGQSGHWLRLAQDVSKRDKHDLDTDVKMYFVTANLAFDAFISCWETKRFYDSSRPWTLIHHFYAGKKVKGWAGPDGGVKEMDGEQWQPYSPSTFITPPFPGYTSGHATVSAACSKGLELFTGSDKFGFRAIRNCCELTEKNAGPKLILDMPTFTATADMAARSRMLGGYHISIDNDVGLKVGRELATWSWPKYKAYFDGTATVR